MASRFERALGNVNVVFRRPEEILDAADLNREQRVKLLQEWDYDLRLMMVATEENMAGPRPGEAADLLVAVRECLDKLGAVAPHSDTKAGD